MGDQGSFSQRYWTIASRDAGRRVDSFLREQLPFLSRRQLDILFREQRITLNGREARKGERLRDGEIVQFSGPALLLSGIPIPNPLPTVPVVYENADLLALDKPAGMDCHGFSGRDTETLANFLVAHWPNLSGIGGSRWEAGLVHRLDRETSGLVLVAKTQAAFDDLRRQFRSRNVKKEYLALVWGAAAEEGTISFPLEHDSKDRSRMRVTSAAIARPIKKKIWRAVTRYRKIAERQGLSLLEVEMKTGVTHQIRVHLAAIAHPIVGDVLYGGDRQEAFGLRRHFLHAHGLRFAKPGSQGSLTLEAPLPAELAALLMRLKMKL